MLKRTRSSLKKNATGRNPMYAPSNPVMRNREVREIRATVAPAPFFEKLIKREGSEDLAIQS